MGEQHLGGTFITAPPPEPRRVMRKHSLSNGSRDSDLRATQSRNWLQLSVEPVLSKMHLLNSALEGPLQPTEHRHRRSRRTAAAE